MRRRALLFVRWASVGQAALAFYFIAASFFQVGLQGRHREAYDIISARTNTPAESLVGLGREATKASQWAESAAWHTLLVGGVLLALATGQFVATRYAHTQRQADETA